MPPFSVQSTWLSEGAGGCVAWQLHAVEQMSIEAVAPLHWKFKVKQHRVPVATEASAEMLIHPVQPTGNGLGAGVKSSLTRVTEYPGHTPASDHGIGFGQLLPLK